MYPGKGRCVRCQAKINASDIQSRVKALFALKARLERVDRAGERIKKNALRSALRNCRRIE